MLIFHIIRAALWGHDLASHVPEHYDWDEMLQTLTDNDMLGVVADAIMSLPADRLPSASWQQRIFNHQGLLLQAHWERDEAIVQMVGWMRERGIHAVLLKGQGLSRLYPMAATRCCGDIDLYVGPANYPQAHHFFDDLCTPEELQAEYENALHAHLEHQGIAYELHRVAGLTAVEQHQADYEVWMDQCLQPERCASVEIHGCEVPIPAPQVYVPYLFNHLCEHILIGVGIRQFVDLAVLLHRYRIDAVQLEADLRRMGLLRVWRILTGILVINLGLPQSECPLYDSCLAQRSQGIILRNVLQDADFGRKSSWRYEANRAQHGWRRVLIRTSIICEMFRLHFILSPRIAFNELGHNLRRTCFGYVRRIFGR